jgi:hypothetical protein
VGYLLITEMAFVDPISFPNAEIGNNLLYNITVNRIEAIKHITQMNLNGLNGKK